MDTRRQVSWATLESARYAISREGRHQLEIESDMQFVNTNFRGFLFNWPTGFQELLCDAPILPTRQQLPVPFQCPK